MSCACASARQRGRLDLSRCGTAHTATRTIRVASGRCFSGPVSQRCAFCGSRSVSALEGTGTQTTRACNACGKQWDTTDGAPRAPENEQEGNSVEVDSNQSGAAGIEWVLVRGDRHEVRCFIHRVASSACALTMTFAGETVLSDTFPRHEDALKRAHHFRDGLIRKGWRSLAV
jgi:hypothetical protein